jgi:hypothetical protein
MPANKQNTQAGTRNTNKATDVTSPTRGKQRLRTKESDAVKVNKQSIKNNKLALGGQPKIESPTLAATRISEAKRKSKDKKRGTKEAMSRDLMKSDVDEATSANLYESSAIDRRWNDTQISQEV